ncbi:MAG TPA: hypothetical protein DEB06_10115, partial [Phycisphaerales bacterium]|nr:hypothetical protein [Phycisphaerales bacterium]
MPGISRLSFESFRMIVARDVARPESLHRASTLILGAGFSVPLVPTVDQMVRSDIARWLHEAESVPATDKPPIEDFQRALWKSVLEHQKLDSELRFEIDPASGLPAATSPSNFWNAYRAVMSDGCPHGLHTLHLRREYFRSLIRAIGKRMNGAHLYLAALAAEQPRFCRTIFTTNFDPLLQRALQLADRAYMISDRPEVLETPDDDTGGAIHLIYTHGTAARYRMLNSKEEIDSAADKNGPLLVHYLKTHPVIVMGWGGAEDALMRALLAVPQFDCGLYWCGTAPDPTAVGALSPEAKQLLSHTRGTHYVHIVSADQTMADLYRAVTGHAFPRLLREPIEVVMDQISGLELDGVRLRREALTPPRPPGGGGGTASSEEQSLTEIRDDVLRRLKLAAEAFGRVDATTPPPVSIALSAFAQATDRYWAEDWEQALTLFTSAIEATPGLPAAERATAMFRRAYASGQTGKPDEAIADYSAVLAMPDAPAEQRAMALVNRGFTYGQTGK